MNRIIYFRKISSLCLILIFVACNSLFSFSQKPTYRITTKDDFLGNKYDFDAYDIEVDSLGYIYFATPEGLYKFDGSRCGLVKGLNCYDKMFYRSLHKDYYGRLWIGGRNGVSKVTRKGVLNFTLPDSLIKFSGLGFDDIYMDSSGILHLAPQGHGYFKVDSSGYVNEVIGKKNGLHGVVAVQLADGHLFHCRYKHFDHKDENYNVYYMDDHGQVTTITKTMTNSLVYESSLVANRDGSFYLSSGEYEIIQFRAGELIKHHTFAHRIIKLFVDSKDNLWIGTIDNGIFKVLDSKFSDMTQYASSAAAMLAEGIDGGLWFSSNTIGFGYISSDAVLHYSEQNGYPFLNGSSSLINCKGKILIKTDEGKLYFFEDGSFKKLSPPKLKHVPGTNKYYDLPTSMCYDQKMDKIWLAYGAGSIQSWDGLRWQTLELKEENFQSTFVVKINAFSDGRVLGFTRCDVFEVKNSKLVRLSDQCDFRIQDVTAEPFGKIWVLERKGGYWILEDKQFIDYPDTLTKDHQDPAFCFYTQNGVWVRQVLSSLYKIRDDTIVEIIDADGNQVPVHNFSIAPNGDIWGILFNEKKLCRITDKNGTQISYFDFDQFAFGELSINNLAVTDDYIYIGSQNGFFLEKIENLISTQIPVISDISKVWINHTEKPIQTYYELPYTENLLNFAFNSISFRREPIEFSYQLAGVDTNWIMTDYNQIQYTNLDPGQYTFKVRSRIKNEDWGEADQISIAIMKPYWQTIWFRICAVILGLLMVLAFYKIRMHYYKRQQDILRQLDYNRQLALKKNMQPHFIFNSLNSIQSYLAQGDKQKSQDFISKFGRLMRDYLDASVNENISIANEMQILERYVELEEFRLDNSIHLTYSVGKTINPKKLMVPSFIIQPLIENSIWHGIAPQKIEGAISVSFNIIEKILEVRISDNGVGISEKKWIEENKAHSTDICKSRLKLMSRLYNTKFEIKRSNRLNENREIIGCDSVLTLPLIRS